VIGAYLLTWWVYLDLIEPRQPARPTQQFAAAIRARTSLPVLFFRAEDHNLAFHVGRPIATLLEWENLDMWLHQPTAVYVVMPVDEARCRCEKLKNGSLVEVLAMTDLTDAPVERPLVLLRTAGRQRQTRNLLVQR
jgi:hypothetical protein